MTTMANTGLRSLYREFTMTVAQLVDEFGLENCSPAIQSLWKTAGASTTRELVVAHAIEPNTDPTYGLSLSL